MSNAFRSLLPRLVFCKCETSTQVAAPAIRRSNWLSTGSIQVRKSSSKSSISFNHDVDGKFPKARAKPTSKVGVLGVPTSLGQPKEGTELGPQYLRGILIPKLGELNVDVKEYGDVVIEKQSNDVENCNVKWPKSHGHNATKISNAVSQIVKDGRLCVTLGGDHSLGLGTVHGHASVQKDLAVIWVDAHADLNTPLSSTSKNFHGMPVSFLIHECQEYVPDMEEFRHMQSCISAKDFVYVGLRSIDPGEKILLDKYQIKYYTMHDIDRVGIPKITEEIREYLKLDDKRPVHMSVDIDALDPNFAMSTGTPVPGGLKLREVLYLTEEIRNNSNLSGIDLVEVNPTLEKSHLRQTLESATQILSTAIGDGRSGYIPEGYVLQKPDPVPLKASKDITLVPYDEEG